MVWEREKKISRIKEIYPPGTRIRLLRMDDTQALPAGTEGNVTFVDDAGQIHMKWDTGSSLCVIYGVDEFVKI